MKNLFNVLIIFLILNLYSVAEATNLLDTLKEAYKNNTKLNAERSKVRATEEGKSEALSEFKPSVTISGYISEQDNTGSSESNFNPTQHSLLIEQKIFQGFAGVANLEKQNYQILQNYLLVGLNIWRIKNPGCRGPSALGFCKTNIGLARR